MAKRYPTEWAIYYCDEQDVQQQQQSHTGTATPCSADRATASKLRTYPTEWAIYYDDEQEIQELKESCPGNAKPGSPAVVAVDRSKPVQPVDRDRKLRSAA